MSDLRAQTEKPIFISYSRANRAFALKLRQKLADLGFKLWRDIEDMPIGEKWWSSLQEAIRYSAKVRVFLGQLLVIICLRVKNLERFAFERFR